MLLICVQSNVHMLCFWQTVCSLLLNTETQSSCFLTKTSAVVFKEYIMRITKNILILRTIRLQIALQMSIHMFIRFRITQLIALQRQLPSKNMCMFLVVWRTIIKDLRNYLLYHCFNWCNWSRRPSWVNNSNSRACRLELSRPPAAGSLSSFLGRAVQPW
jgi:hypothetical protein